MRPMIDERSDRESGLFSAEQKEFLAGLMAGVAQRNLWPYVGTTGGGRLTAEPALGGANLAGGEEELVFGTPKSDLCKQELWKLEENPLDIWEKLLAHSESDAAPDEADTFRFRYHGLFYVAPAQNSFMVRCRIPAGELTALQLRGLAELAEEVSNGIADITTRANIQIREIAPRNIIKVLTKLQEIGLTSRGSGVDNVRNITASPTAGIDPVELIDTRPFAKALHYYILNHRDLFGLPRKFNVAFDGGGAVSAVADTNDIGFMAVRVGEGKPVAPGIYFRVELAGITGHKQFAADSGIVVAPAECVAVAAAMIRVFNENGCRTDRKKARLKYLIDSWGVARFLEETEKKLAFPLRKLALEECEERHPALKHGHLGVYKQKQRGLNYVGVAVPVGRMRVKQMRRLAELAENYGSGNLRLTPWQNLVLADVPDGFVETVKRSLVRAGLHYEASSVAGGLVACTGNTGCKWAATDTKGQAVALARYLEQRVQLDQPINIHLTGCPNSCAQHYIGDIGLQGVKTKLAGETVEAYNVVLGGGYGDNRSVAREVFMAIPFSALPQLLEKVLTVYMARRQPGEDFAGFTRRHEVKELQELFSE